jgi:hypothetical protein
MAWNANSWCVNNPHMFKVNLPVIEICALLSASGANWFGSTCLTALTVPGNSNLITTSFINPGNEVSIMVTTNWTVRN